MPVIFLFSCLGVLIERKKISRREHSFLNIPSKESNSKIFIPPKFGGIRENEIRFNEFYTKTSKLPLYIQLFYFKI